VNYAALYSGFAVVVVFFVWLNLAWLIVLLGGMVAYLHQHALVFMRGWPAEMPDFAFEEWLVLAALSDIGRRYLSRTQPATESELSDRLGVPLAQIERVIDKCVRRGLLLRLAEPRGISLARAPEDILAAEILETVRGELIVPTMKGEAVAELLGSRDALLRRGLADTTLKNLVHEFVDDLPPGEEVVEEMRRDH
jgi:membrane protein